MSQRNRFARSTGPGAMIIDMIRTLSGQLTAAEVGYRKQFR
jgi:hypothetical protein